MVPSFNRPKIDKKIIEVIQMIIRILQKYHVKKDNKTNTQKLV